MADQDAIKQLLDKISSAGQKCVNNEAGGRVQLLNILATAQREIEGPGLYLSRSRLTPLCNICQLMAIETGMLNAVVQAGRPITAAEIAKAIKLDEQMTGRIMRLLAVHGIFHEVGPATYQSNAVAAFLNTPEQGGATRNMVELMFPIAGKVVSQLRSSQGLSQFPDSGPGVTPFRATYGPQSMFEFFETNQEHKEAFDLYMVGRAAGVRRRWFETYPVRDRLISGAHQSQDDVFLIDVGGNKGQDLATFHQAYPRTPGRLILQDLDLTLQSVPETLDSRIETLAYDFFTEQPVKGARAYYFRAIFHDWSNSKCIDILKNTAKAMIRGYSKIIIDEMVLLDQGEGFRGASLDILMFLMPEGIERALSQWESLLAGAGLKMIKYWPSPDGTESVIEAELA